MILKCDKHFLLNGLKLCLMGALTSSVLVSGRFAVEDSNEGDLTFLTEFYSSNNWVTKYSI